MKTVKFNEEELELLIALYEDELKEAGAYIEKLEQTLDKFKRQAASVQPAPSKTGKKRGRKPKKQVQQRKPSVGGKKRGRKPRVQEAAKPEPVKAAVKKTVRKKKARKPVKPVSAKPAAQKPVKPVKVEKPATEETKTV
jgi:hypothetical protein